MEKTRPARGSDTVQFICNDVPTGYILKISFEKSYSQAISEGKQITMVFVVSSY